MIDKIRSQRVCAQCPLLVQSRHPPSRYAPLGYLGQSLVWDAVELTLLGRKKCLRKLATNWVFLIFFQTPTKLCKAARSFSALRLVLATYHPAS